VNPTVTFVAMVELNYVLMKHGPPFVMNTGIMWMQVLFVINWDTLDMVSLCMANISIDFGAYNSTGAIANSNSFIENVWPVAVTNISCTGNEEALLQCSFSTEPIGACNQRSDASVLCQSESQITILLLALNV
jgi:hypothetical protein